MKKIYTLLALALVCGSVMAQSSNDGVKFGVRAGVNLASFALSGTDYDTEEGKLAKDNQKMVTSFSFGGYVDVPVSDVFSFQPGLSISGKGSKVSYVESGVEDGDPYSTTIEGTRNLMYLEVPLNAIFKVKNFYFGAGPYIGYALSGKDKSKFTSTFINPITGLPVTESGSRDEKIEIGNDKAKDTLKPLDFGLNALVGYKLDNGLNFGANYGFGLANTETNGDSNSKTTNRVISVSVGFSF